MDVRYLVDSIRAFLLGQDTSLGQTGWSSTPTGFKMTLKIEARVWMQGSKRTVPALLIKKPSDSSLGFFIIFSYLSSKATIRQILDSPPSHFHGKQPIIILRLDSSAICPPTFS